MQNYNNEQQLPDQSTTTKPEHSVKQSKHANQTNRIYSNSNLSWGTNSNKKYTGNSSTNKVGKINWLEVNNLLEQVREDWGNIQSGCLVANGTKFDRVLRCLLSRSAA